MTIDFIEGLIAVLSKRSRELRDSAVSVQGTLGSSQLAGCYHAVFRNNFYPKVKPTLNIPELRELVLHGEDPELLYPLGAIDGQWVTLHLDDCLALFGGRLWGPEMFRLMHLQLGFDPYDAAEKLISVLKDDDRRLKDLWACLETFALMAERKGVHAKFVDFVRDVGVRARPSGESESS